MSLKLVKKISIIKPRTKLSHNTFTFSILIQYSNYLILDELLQNAAMVFFMFPLVVIFGQVTSPIKNFSN